MFTTSYRKALVLGVISAVGTWGVVDATVFIAYTPWLTGGYRYLDFASDIAFMVGIICVFGAIALVPLLGLVPGAMPWLGKIGLFFLPHAIVFPLTLALANLVLPSYREAQMEAFVARSADVVQGLHRYEDDNGRPPFRLQDPVPDYLPELPTTGISACPEYHYLRTGSVPGYFEGNPWVLFIRGGPLYPLAYYPLQNYPETDERLGDWGYNDDLFLD